MKKAVSSITLLVIAILFNSIAAVAQNKVPQGFSYQAVLRDAVGKVVPNTNISVRASILDATATGTVLYVDSTTVQSNLFGVINYVVGSGNSRPNKLFTAIPWSNGADKWLKMEVDFKGGNSYQILATTKLNSVPFALFSGSSGNSSNITGGNGISVIGGVVKNTKPDTIVTLSGINGVVVTGMYPSFTINGQNKDFKAGDGIDIANGQIINTKPDVPVILNSKTPIKIDGTYPNFTVSAPGVVSYKAGNGIGFNKDTIINTLPDVPVKLIGQGSTTITGLYPNFIVKSVGKEYKSDANQGVQIVGDSIFNTRPDVPVTLSGNGGIIITGNYPDFTIFGTAPKIYRAGTGINILGPNIDSIVNVAPDKIVTLTAGNGISITGGYPNFNVGTNFVAGTGIKLTGNQIINLNPDVPVTLQGAAGSGISVSGVYPNFTINNAPNNTIIRSVAASVIVPPIASQGTQPASTVTVTNAATSATVTASPTGALPSGLFIQYAYVSAANTVIVVFGNSGATIATSTAVSLNITVIQ